MPTMQYCCATEMNKEVIHSTTRMALQTGLMKANIQENCHFFPHLFELRDRMQTCGGEREQEATGLVYEEFPLGA